MIILPAQLDSFRSLVDKSLKLTFSTQELTPEQAGFVNQSLQTFGYLAFKDNPFKDKELELLEGLEAEYDDGKKTPSQRLRNVLYRLWEKNPEGYEDHRLHYQFKMEKIINHYKKLLDD